MRTSEIIDNIRNFRTFKGISESEGFYIEVESYVPYMGGAIHAGHKLREEIRSKCILSEFERWQEEDPYTDTFIKNFPIKIIALDSRYEYDLNRDKDSCIYEDAWGKKVWNTELTEEEKEGSLAKYNEFYSVVEELLKALEFMYEKIYVYDIHSYNHKRDAYAGRNLPLFNLGTTELPRDIFSKDIDKFLGLLSKMEIEGHENYTAENDIFKGKGQFLKFITEISSQTITYALEIKKVFCDENSGEHYEEIINNLEEEFNKIVENHTKELPEEFSIHFLNNFGEKIEDLSYGEAEKICSLVTENYRKSNEGEYSKDEIEKLVSTRTPEAIIERSKKGLLIYFKNKMDEVVACGSIAMRDGNPEAKLLNVGKNYRGRGFAQKICDLREKFLKELGFNKVYIESLKFENTIKFHSKRGFFPIQTDRKLKYTVFMCKEL
nr:GNAT family N-acetyltransferase [Psychrilyobacter piezotolerans]